MMGLARLREWWHRPQQMGLPFHCSNYNEECEYVRDPNKTGFYVGRCWKCGADYDPGCDR